MQQDASQLAQYLSDTSGKYQGGAFYLCGPTWPEGPVQNAIESAFVASAGLTKDQSKERIQQLKDAERYVLEVYRNCTEKKCSPHHCFISGHFPSSDPSVVFMPPPPANDQNGTHAFLGFEKVVFLFLAPSSRLDPKGCCDQLEIDSG